MKRTERNANLAEPDWNLVEAAAGADSSRAAHPLAEERRLDRAQDGLDGAPHDGSRKRVAFWAMVMAGPIAIGGWYVAPYLIVKLAIAGMGGLAVAVCLLFYRYYSLSTQAEYQVNRYYTQSSPRKRRYWHRRSPSTAAR